MTMLITRYDIIITIHRAICVQHRPTVRPYNVDHVPRYSASRLLLLLLLLLNAVSC